MGRSRTSWGHHDADASGRGSHADNRPRPLHRLRTRPVAMDRARGSGADHDGGRMTALDATSPATGKPNELRTVLSALDAFLAAHDHRTESVAEFLGAQFDAGLAWVQFDQGSGGLGVDAGLNRVVRKRLAAAGAPDNFRSNTG